MKNVKLTFTLLAITLGSCLSSLAQDIPSMMGGVAGSTNRSDESFVNSFSSSNVSGVHNPRLSIYPNRYWDTSTNQPTPEEVDELILMAHDHGQDLALYFIHYLEESGDPGDYNKWYAIGQAFATRFGKNSAWLASKGITDWGSTTFMAFNEPWHNTQSWDPQVFKDCMDGLGDGVHSVNPDFIVTPGGMPTYLLPDRNPLIGAITPLLNDGTLDGLTFHLYNDTRRERPWRMDYEFNSQAVFDAVKSHWGITADIYYHVTEYMPKADDDIWKAKYFLMHTWSNLGVVGNQGQPVTKHIAPYLYTITTSAHDQFGMADVDWLWHGNLKGRVYQMVSRLTSGMQFVSLDPRGSGEFVLEGNGKRLIVWQNAEGWTNHLDSSFTVQNIPATASHLEVYRYDSWTQPYGGHGGDPDPYQSITLSGQTSYTVDDLPPGECYMFMLYDGGTLNQHPTVAITNITEDQVFSEGDSITIAASVSDSDSQIEEVRFFTDRSMAGVLRTSPYEITLSDVPIGRTQLIVTAKDEHGGFNVSTVNIIVEPKGEFVRATDDAYVRGDNNAGTNYGADPDVITKFHTRLKDRYDAYFNFDLSGIGQQSVDSAHLRLRVNRKGAVDINMHHVVDDSWDQSSLTWNNKPPASDPILSFEPASNGEWMKIDITSLVNTELGGDKMLSLVLVPERLGQDTRFYAQESSIYNAAFIAYKKVFINVDITTPLDSTEVPYMTPVTISVDASDSVSTITKVEFFANGNKLGESTSAPYSLIWTGAPAGNYSITAVAVNAQGDQKTSEEVFLSIVDPAQNFLTPEADTYVRSGNSSALNFGTSEELEVKKGGIHFKFETLLKFDLSGIKREVLDAKLRLNVIHDDEKSGDPDHTLYFVSDDSWEENVVTWDTKPTTDSVLSVQVAPNLGQWMEYDVTSIVKAQALSDSTITFMMGSSNNTSLIYASRESSSFLIWPQLVVITLPEPPAAPSNLSTVVMSDTQVNLTWADNAGNEEGFIIERKADTTHVFSPIATVGAGITQYNDSGLACETTYTYRVKANNAGGPSGYSNESAGVTRLCPNGQASFGGSPWNIPGTIEAEDFDEGGQGLSYYDKHPYNIGRAYRSSEGVDIGHVRGGGHYVGWNWSGEWLEYTVYVEAAGEYNIEAEVASWSRRGRFHIEFEGVDKTGAIPVPRTWGWQRWRTIEAGTVSLPVGKQIMRLYLDRGLFNLNSLTFTRSDTGYNTRKGADSAIDQEEGLHQDIAIYPNPTKGRIKIAGVEDQEVMIYNTLGIRVMQATLQAGELDLSSLGQGVYILMIPVGDEHRIKRIIKE